MGEDRTKPKCQCGADVVGRFCPDCGESVAPPGPLWDLHRHIRTQAKAMRSRANTAGTHRRQPLEPSSWRPSREHVERWEKKAERWESWALELGLLLAERDKDR